MESKHLLTLRYIAFWMIVLKRKRTGNFYTIDNALCARESAEFTRKYKQTVLTISDKGRMTGYRYT